MRVGATNQGTWWVSMSPLGWLILGPFVAVFWLITLPFRIIATLTRKNES